MPQKDNEVIDKLLTIAAELDKGRATTEDLNAAVETLTQLVVTYMEATKAEKEAFFEKADSTISGALKSLTSRIEGKLASLRQPADGYTPQKGIDYFDGKTPVKGIDYFDGEAPDIEEIVMEVLDQIPEQVQYLGEDFRNALEALPDGEKLSIDAIEGLRDELKKIRKSGGQVYGASTQAFANTIRHEEFTMDGATNTVTLLYGVAAQGHAIVALRYQGQTLDYGSDYSVDGNKITLVDTPESGTIISVTYFA